MKSVLMSIKPKYCELIAAGKKTIEVRKTKPKIETPFKCYIYCTLPKERFSIGQGNFACSDNLYLCNNKIKCGDGFEDFDKETISLNGKVIGEFVCDCIIPISIKYSDPNNRIAQKEFPYTCLTDKEIMDYLGNGNQGYGWHISKLKIYAEPKRLREFWHCGVKLGARVSRPPQSWCYVEEV